MKPIFRTQSTYFRTKSTHAVDLSSNLDEMPFGPFPMISLLVILLHIITFIYFSLIEAFTVPFSTNLNIAKTLHYTYGLHGFCTFAGDYCKQVIPEFGFFDAMSDPNVDWATDDEWRNFLIGFDALFGTLSFRAVLLSLVVTVCALEGISVLWRSLSLTCNVFACIFTCTFTSTTIATFHPNGSRLLWASVPVSTGLIVAGLLQIYLLVKVCKYNKRKNKVPLIYSPIVSRARRLS
ncbi:unnamed protein product [Ambrosiozyma monospora]|uniref:Unnamed protein product n=1 Tax=Ambrosiozyma monospora TaxID=43982 RepID=A0ACB5STK2_AMBMO|nr:unnamed protein product [Ambrosiozyma monospora]